jgi:hypothetical protein
MDLTKYTAVTKPLVINIEGEVLNITYRPNIYTLGFARELGEALESKDFDRQAETFARLVASWDLYLNEQDIVPLNAEGIQQVPMQVLAAIDSAIADAVRPSEDEKKGSSELTSTPSTDSSEPPATFPNGSETSTSPTVSESVPST